VRTRTVLAALVGLSLAAVVGRGRSAVATLRAAALTAGSVAAAVAAGRRLARLGGEEPDPVPVELPDDAAPTVED